MRTVLLAILFAACEAAKTLGMNFEQFIEEAKIAWEMQGIEVRDDKKWPEYWLG